MQIQQFSFTISIDKMKQKALFTLLVAAEDSKDCRPSWGSWAAAVRTRQGSWQGALAAAEAKSTYGPYRCWTSAHQNNWRFVLVDDLVEGIPPGSNSPERITAAKKVQLKLDFVLVPWWRMV